MEGNIFVAARNITGDRTYAGQTVLRYDVKYPQFAAHEALPGIRRLNAMYRRQALGLARGLQAAHYLEAVGEAIERERQGEPLAAYEFDRSFTVTYAQDCLISLYMDDYRFTGGANGHTARASGTWNARTGAVIPLSELFPADAEYRRELETLINAEIAARRQENETAYWDDSASLVGQYFDENHFYLTPEALVFYFQQDQIAPHATGIPEFAIPYNRLFVLLPNC